MSEAFHQPRFERIADEKRERILSAAVGEFAEYGLANANVNRIAERSGVSIGSLYQYFRTKEDLFLSLVSMGYRNLEEALAPALLSTLDTLGKIRSIISLVLDQNEEQKALTRLYNRFTTEGNSELARELANRMESYTAKAYAALLAQAKAEGLMDPDADERAFAFFMDGIFLTLQFSVSAEYWRDRLDIYLGTAGGEGDAAVVGSDDERRAILAEQAFRFIRNALTGGPR